MATSLALALAIGSVLGTPALAQERASAETRTGREFRIGLEELNATGWRTGDTRQIRTTNLDLLLRIRKFEHPYLELYGGLTLSRARGTVTGVTGSSEAGTLASTNFDSSATGAGPVLAARAEFWRRENLTACVDGSAGVLLYNRDFPARSSRYEFMVRIGPVLSYRLNAGQTLSLGYTVMHVSNGQERAGHNNPTYNARGVGVQFLNAF